MAKGGGGATDVRVIDGGANAVRGIAATGAAGDACGGGAGASSQKLVPDVAAAAAAVELTAPAAAG